MTTDWIIQQMECKVSENGLSNVVFKIHWMYRGTDIVESFVNDKLRRRKNVSTRLGTTILPTPTPSSFTKYEELSKEQVIGWLTDILGQDYINNMTTELQNNNYLRLNPTEVYLKPPFIN